MAFEKQGFPDDRDRELQRKAEETWEFADDLVEWAGKYVEPRRWTDYEISPDQEFSLYRLRRLASNLYRSSNVPVAAAVYGASQVGKSLFIARVLEPATGDSPLGKDDQLGPPAYIPELSFEKDINPQSGSNEATALVTRFTTMERFDETALPEYPVKIRALTRAEWLRVLARGFRSECVATEEITWREGQVRELFEEVSRDHSAEAVDRDWRMDLLDVYAYLRGLDPRQYEISESMFNSFLSQFPLTDGGYVEIAGRMFWDSPSFPELTNLFNDVCRFIKKITSRGKDGILVDWGAVRFLLDSQRAEVQKSPYSAWKKEIAWSDFSDGFEGDWYVINHQQGGTKPSADLAIIQSAMLEMTIPVIPHRLKEDWRDVILKMDLLDLPGMRAAGSDSQGGAKEITKEREKMNVVKRGKVFYLIDRFLEERQVQTLLLLVRGGNLEVRQLLKDYIDKWGRARYGDDAWPRKADTTNPALFVGMTGIDDEFDKQAVNDNLYEHRLNQLVNETLYEVMTDFGGPGRPFTNVFPIRYPGTWDANEQRRQACGDPQKWNEAKRVFLDTPMVRKFVSDPEKKWDVAMRDHDGGLSLISSGFIGCTNSIQKQQALETQIHKVREDLYNLGRVWHVNPDVNEDREARIAAAEKVIEWLDDPQHVYDRVCALRTSLCFEEGDAMEVAEFSESRSVRSRKTGGSLEQRFSDFLRGFLSNWARELATARWREFTEKNESGAPWLPMEDFSTFVRYLCDYLCCGGAFEQLSGRLLSVIKLQIQDEGDRHHAQREYARVILNDFVMNPGPDGRMPVVEDKADGNHFGLMGGLVKRWQSRLPQALAAAAGAHVNIPKGNDELGDILGQST